MELNGRRLRAVVSAVRHGADEPSPQPGPIPVEQVPAPVRVPGVVEEFSARLISGWVHVDKDADPVRITLRLDNHEIAGTWAVDTLERTAWGEVRGFTLRLHDVWQYSNRRSRLTVRADGVPLPLAGYGMFRRGERNGPHSVDDLLAKLSDGHVFSHDGVLQLSKQLDAVWQGRVMDLYEVVREQVREVRGHDVFFLYGTLLGAVRDGGYIGHDNDFDCGYLSELTDPTDVADELYEIALSFAKAGVHVRAFPSAVHVYHPDDPGTRIDLFHLYFDSDGLIQFPFGIAGTSEVHREDWQGTRTIDFRGGHGLVPVNAEQLVEHIYGAGWGTPTPGFDWSRDRTARAPDEALLPSERMEDVYWANFYNRNDFSEPSSFCTTLLERDDLPKLVLDIGCGEGRDSLAFAASGRSVTGVDSCAIGLEHARAKAGSTGADLTLHECDVADDAAFEAVLSALSTGDPMLYYLRFFLHTIPEDVQDRLLTALAARARPGDGFAAEFRTLADEGATKAHGMHFRRFIDAAALADRLRADGWTVLAEQSGTGLAPYHAANSRRSEDPQVGRIVARLDR